MVDVSARLTASDRVYRCIFDTTPGPLSVPACAARDEPNHRYHTIAILHLTTSAEDVAVHQGADSIGIEYCHDLGISFPLLTSKPSRDMLLANVVTRSDEWRGLERRRYRRIVPAGCHFATFSLRRPSPALLPFVPDISRNKTYSLHCMMSMHETMRALYRRPQPSFFGPAFFRCLQPFRSGLKRPRR